jgi:hypothetical protein
MSERGRVKAIGTAAAAAAAVLGAFNMGWSIGHTPEALVGIVSVAAGVLFAEAGGYGQERLVSWLWPFQVAQHVGSAAVLALVPLFFLRAPTGVWVGTILQLFAQLKHSQVLTPQAAPARRRL